jgi:hypothetical protein
MNILKNDEKVKRLQKDELVDKMRTKGCMDDEMMK